MRWAISQSQIHSLLNVENQRLALQPSFNGLCFMQTVAESFLQLLRIQLVSMILFTAAAVTLTTCFVMASKQTNLATVIFQQSLQNTRWVSMQSFQTLIGL